MAQIVIPIRDQDLKDEIGLAYAATFANPDGLTNQELIVKHVSNDIRRILNDYREKIAIEQAKAGVVKEDTLD